MNYKTWIYILLILNYYMNITGFISKMLPDDQNISNSDDTRSQMSQSKLNYLEDQLLLPSYFYPGFQLGYHSR